ncbi:Oxoglutarate/iron-dependent dioxygenase [Oxalobacteraceae bacterium]
MELKGQSMHNLELINTSIQTAATISEAEAARINESLRSNGIAVIKGFIGQAQLSELQRDAIESLQDGFDAGAAISASIKMAISESTAEFKHPFLISKVAVELAINSSLIRLIEAYLGNEAIIHHALFQRSIPINEPAVDWHVDTGSHKVLNGSKRFPDRRLRMIVYLTDVKSGGLSYIPDSLDAATCFLGLPQGTLYPQSDVSSRLYKRVTINEGAGTVILFDAHGLHRPEPPRDSRIVLNIWFARSDFSASLPPVLVSVASVPKSQLNAAYIFGNERGERVNQASGTQNAQIPLLKRLVLKLATWKKNDSK